MSGINNPGLPDWTHASRSRAVRANANPLDKCTIVSIVPKAIKEVKHTLTPGVFRIPKPPEDGFSLLVIGTSSWFKEMEEGQPFLEIQEGSMRVAESVVVDYMNGLWCCDMGDVKPGLFYIPGAFDEKSILTQPEFILKMDKAKKDQHRWFEELVNQADILWARTNGNPLAISDDARMAAEILHLNKSWMQDFQAMQLTNCKACGELINPNFPVCKNCHAIIDEKVAKDLNIKFAS